MFANYIPIVRQIVSQIKSYIKWEQLIDIVHAQYTIILFQQKQCTYKHHRCQMSNETINTKHPVWRE